MSSHNPKPLELAELGYTEYLNQSWQAVARRRAGPGPDGESVEAFVGSLHENLRALREELLSGAYVPRPAKRIWLAKTRGGERGVLVLCVRDRVAQGAVRRALNPYLKDSFHPASFAYREGRGALQAARRIIEHRDMGREWIVRGDIASFFDSVPHGQLFERLAPMVSAQALDIVIRSVACPLQDGGNVGTLVTGLPQGGPLSPLLANFYLNPFDAAVSLADTGPVRFADDFAVACPSPSRAGDMLERAEAALGRLALRLNESKTQIVAFRQGFDFLGFRFQGQGVRVAPARIREFKTHMEHLLSPRFGSSSRGTVRQANDLIRGWRTYFQLGEVALDFEELDAWLAERFGVQADTLESLVPKPQRRPTLGGYEGRASRVAAPTPAVARKQQPRPSASLLEPVRCNPEGLPTHMFRNGIWLAVKELPALQLSEETWKGLAGPLERASLYHRASLAARWQTVAAQEAVLACAAALSGRQSSKEAQASYEVALFGQAPEGCDLRQARGVLRRGLRLQVWQALLKTGLTVGPEQSGLPKLVLHLAAAYEAPIADFCLLRALKSQRLTKPLAEFKRVLSFRVAHGCSSAQSTKPWTAVLDAEAAAFARSITDGSGYIPWLFGGRA